jgi:hypothetical protein
MSDSYDPEELEYIERKYSEYPSSSDIGSLCYELGIKKDARRTIRKEDAWAYYHELKAMVDQQQRKTA